MTTKALLVGINDYAPVGPGGPDLRGCVNDVQDMLNTLMVLGLVRPPFRPFLRLHTNAAATRTNILRSVEWLIAGAKAEDHLIFYYSGHGSQLPNQPGSDAEPDAKDETLVPHDFATAGMIRDDDLQNLFRTVPRGVNLEVISDSCHSGTVTRALGEREMPDGVGDVPAVVNGTTVRYIDPPYDEGFLLEAYPHLPTRTAGAPLKTSAGAKELVPSALNHVLWGACKSGQTAGERLIEGRYRGVFTYWFCKVVRRAGVGALRHFIDAQVTREVQRYNQTPQLEGVLTAFRKPVFGATREVFEAAMVR